MTLISPNITPILPSSFHFLFHYPTKNRYDPNGHRSQEDVGSSRQADDGKTSLEVGLASGWQWRWQKPRHCTSIAAAAAAAAVAAAAVAAAAAVVGWESEGFVEIALKH